MMAPVLGKLLAEALTGGPVAPVLDKWNLRRYREGKLLSEAMILG
jgi:sarcosine oxidase subunit beta